MELLIETTHGGDSPAVKTNGTKFSLFGFDLTLFSFCFWLSVLIPTPNHSVEEFYLEKT
jgi:hypothetical protein